MPETERLRSLKPVGLPEIPPECAAVLVAKQNAERLELADKAVADSNAGQKKTGSLNLIAKPAQ